MSSENTKAKVSRRIHQTESHVAKQVKIAKQHGLSAKDKTIKQPHRLAKHNALDCGQTGCVLCGNPRKLFGELTIQERRFYQEEKEGGQDGNAADC